MNTHADHRDPAALFEAARDLSPRRHTSGADDLEGLVREQLEHFGLDPQDEFGRRLGRVAHDLYAGNADLKALWETAQRELATLGRSERAARFSAMRFLAFQMAKILDTLMHPMRTGYQSVVSDPFERSRKGPYPVFDNVTALFSSKPVITRTATYIYACAEWVDDAFHGREMLHEIYSRLLNPTSVSLANHIVDVECGPEAPRYMAWNFNSGMAAVDAILSHLVGYKDIILASRNVYGGVYQLLVDWYGKASNLDVAIEFFDGYTEQDFLDAYDACAAKHKDRLANGRRIYLYIESPCNPHGYVLDVPAMARAAHERGLEVICDSTVGTPYLHRPLRRDDETERPDFVIHSYTKDISGHGSTTAGCVIGLNERMFMPKNASTVSRGHDGRERETSWDDTLFWNVYYIKGAFLDAEKAYEVINGLHTLDHRMLAKAINTRTLADVLGRHPNINVCCAARPEHPNHPLLEKCMHLGLPAPLFTFDFEGDSASGRVGSVSPEAFKRFFDMLDPVFGHQVSLGTPNTIILCPAITSHSEMSRDALAEAGITPTTIRVSVGLEDPRTLVAHMIRCAQVTIDPETPGFSDAFPSPAQVDAAYKAHYTDIHRASVESAPGLEELLQ